MKRTAITSLIIAATLSITSSGVVAEDKKADELLQSGLTRETVQGDLKSAIELYEKAVKEAGSNHAIAAKAQLRLANAYRKQGNAQAHAAYERLVRDFGDQPEAGEAREQLAIMDGPQKVNPAAVPVHRDALEISAFKEPGNAGRGRLITLFDRQGHVLGTVGERGANGTMTLSPDGKKVALVQGGAIVLLDIASKSVTKLTAGPRDAQPTWSADGRRIAFQVLQGQPRRPVGIYVAPVAVPGAEAFISPVSDLTLVSWSRDGRYLTYQRDGGATGYDLWLIPVMGDRQPTPVLTTVAAEMGLRISPDGRFISYRSRESGRAEAYVRPFDLSANPEAPSGDKWQISVGGVSTAGVRWRSDEKEMYFISASGGVMAVDVTTTPTFKAGTPRLLFQVPDSYQRETTTAGFNDVSADGTIFALSVP